MRVIEKSEMFAVVQFDPHMFAAIRARNLGERGIVLRKLSPDEDLVYSRITQSLDKGYVYEAPDSKLRDSRKRLIRLMPGQWVLIGENGEVRIEHDLDDYEVLP